MRGENAVQINARCRLKQVADGGQTDFKEMEHPNF
jgi:hypothetical protein